MSRLEVLTWKSIPSLVNANSLYLIGYAWLFGSSVWNSFFGGIIAIRVLPRHQFGALQNKTFPVYFLQSIILSGALLTKWIYSHPDVLTNIMRPNVADVAQAYVLTSVLASQSFNYFVVGPRTSKIMFQRHRLEREEGKQSNDPGVSAEMKVLNRKFMALHGISSLANLTAVLALGFHGLWIGNAGVKGY